MHKGSNLLIGELYRVPNSNSTDSIHYYDTIVGKLQSENKCVILVTDQN